MNKEAVIKAIIFELEIKLKTLVDAAMEAHQAATDPENIARSKYETNGLSFSYLAQAQAELSQQAEKDLQEFKDLEVKDFSHGEEIRIGALLTIENDGQLQRLFLAPCAGGIEAECEGKKIRVITPQSPIGQILLGRSVGDLLPLPNGISGTLLAAY